MGYYVKVAKKLAGGDLVDRKMTIRYATGTL
jgi:hypothetical protein